MSDDVFGLQPGPNAQDVRVNLLWNRLGETGFVEGDELSADERDVARLLIRMRIAHFIEGRLRPMTLQEQLDRLAARYAEGQR